MKHEKNPCRRDSYPPSESALFLWRVLLALFFLLGGRFLGSLLGFFRLLGLLDLLFFLLDLLLFLHLDFLAEESTQVDLDLGIVTLHVLQHGADDLQRHFGVGLLGGAGLVLTSAQMLDLFAAILDLDQAEGSGGSL